MKKKIFLGPLSVPKLNPQYVGAPSAHPIQAPQALRLRHEGVDVERISTHERSSRCLASRYRAPA